MRIWLHHQFDRLKKRLQPVEKVHAKPISSESGMTVSPLGNSTHWQKRRSSCASRRKRGLKAANKRHTWPPMGTGVVPIPANYSKRLRFCPVAIPNASQLPLQSLLKRKRRMPCHSFASANKGSTHILRLRSAF